jgi:hypothetical protein
MKNKIILHNDIYGFHTFSVLYSHEIFDRFSMSNLLEMIENKTYYYDDIIDIDIENLIGITNINVLPQKLKKLKIIRSILDSITIPQNCINIQEITICFSNLREIPEIHFLQKLKLLMITNSQISKLPNTFPNSLHGINLSNNALSNKNCNLRVFPKNTSIILFQNFFTEKEDIPGYFFSYGTQFTSRINQIYTNYDIAINENRKLINLAFERRRREEEEYQRRIIEPLRQQPVLLQPIRLQPIQPQPIIQQQINNTPTIFNTNQTVHISSICNSTAKSIVKIKEFTKDTYNANIQKQLLSDFLYDGYINTNSWYDYIKYKLLNMLPYNAKNQLKTWINDTTMHSKTQITYGELLARIYILAKNHEKKSDFINNIKFEINDSIGMCFTGRINRLVNSAVGFIDDIYVGISIKEQLQLEIGIIIDKLSKKEIDFQTANKEITNLFEDPLCKEDETINDYYKNAWLDALNDYKE